MEKIDNEQKAANILIMKDTSSKWEDNAIQFPRLIEEAQGVGAFTPEVLRAMAESMDLTTPQVCELLDRAQATWDRLKQKTP